MIHTASLIHDDIIDDADIRRGQPTVNRIWGERKATAAGKFIVSQASCALARMGDSRVIDLLATAMEDVVYGKLLYVNCPVYLTSYEKHLNTCFFFKQAVFFWLQHCSVDKIW